MGIPSSTFSAAQKRMAGIAPAPKPRAARGTGAALVAKANRLARLPAILELLDVDTLPVDVEVTGKPHTMNGLERSYANMLDSLQFAGLIVAYDFEPIRLHIGVGRCFFKVDFIVRYPDGHIEAVDCKGERHASGIRGIRTAAKLFPQWRFRILTKKRGAWIYEEISPENK